VWIKSIDIAMTVLILSMLNDNNPFERTDYDNASYSDLLFGYD